QRDVAGRGFVPAGGNANQRLVNLLRGEPHRVEVGAVRSARGALRHVTAWKPVLDVGLGVHHKLVSSAAALMTRFTPVGFPRLSRTAAAFCPRKIISLRGVAKKRRKQELAGADAKCSPTVAVSQHSLRDSNHLLTRGRRGCVMSGATQPPGHAATDGLRQ